MDQIEILKYHAQGLCCSQIMVKLTLDLMGKENRELVNFTRGLCMGSGTGDGTCGIFTAGSGILYMVAGTEPKALALMQEAWTDFFEAAVPEPGETGCSQIISTPYPQPDMDTCPGLLLDSFSRLMSIFQENGIDPQNLPET